MPMTDVGQALAHEGGATVPASLGGPSAYRTPSCDLSRPSVQTLLAEASRDIDRFFEELAAGCLVPLAGVEAVVEEQT